MKGSSEVEEKEARVGKKMREKERRYRELTLPSTCSAILGLLGGELASAQSRKERKKTRKDARYDST
jgi:hypothetical protein